MTARRYATVAALSIALAASYAARTAAQDHHIVIPPEKVQWGPAPPILPHGAQIAVLEGNPAEKGTVVMRLKFPANYVVPPHWHSMTERVTVLSGMFHVGAGDTVDRPGSQTLGPGGYVMLPAKMHHYAWVNTPTVVQIDLQGPFDLFYVNAKDDPRHPNETASNAGDASQPHR